MSSGDPETRQRLLEVTCQLVEERRGQNVRLEDVAKAAGVSRQAVYLHFGNRTTLLVETARYLDEKLKINERLQPVLVEQGAVSMLEAYVDFWAAYIPDVYGLAKALLIARDTDEGAATAWDDRMKESYQGCLLCTNCLVRDNLLAPEWTAETAAAHLWGTFSVQTWEILTQERGWTNEQFRDRMKVALKRALVKS